MTPGPARRAALAALACASALAGCLSDEPDPPQDKPIRGDTLTIYASRPDEGPSAATAAAVAAGQRQALADDGRRAGRYRVELVELSSSEPGAGNWDPGRVSENAARAARDPRAIAYLGELNLGASAVSVPVTNEAGLLQVSPADGLASLTEEPPRSAAGPERYFPSGRRSFLRLVPDDLLQAAVLVDRMAELGVRRPALIVGTGVYARELAAEVAAESRRAGMPPVETVDLRDDPQTVLDAPRELAEADVRPDAVVLALARDRYARSLLAGLSRTLPGAPLLTADGMLVGQPLVVAPGSQPARLEAVAPGTPDGRAARRVLDRIGRGQGAALAQPAALWGYESVDVALDAIRAAQRGGRDADRRAVVAAALRPRERRGPIGAYRVRRNGSVEGLPLAIYTLSGDRFED